MNPEYAIRNSEFTGIAPGRLDVMGGIADYSGSLLLQMPIRERTYVTIDLSEGYKDRFVIESAQEEEIFEIRVDQISGLSYPELGNLARSIPGGDWALYVIGCFAVLHKEKELDYSGAHVFVASEVPIGKGVSSSASLEVATMHAICKAYDLHLDPVELAVLAQRVENLVVGAACGLMDQLSVNLGMQDRLLPIICQPHDVFEPISIPAGIRFFGLDSGVRHAVSAASYGDVRTAAFMAFTVAMMKTGTSPEQLKDHQQIPFGGFWANVDLDKFYDEYAHLIPRSMKGSSFLEKFGVHIDPVTTIDPQTEYALYHAALHPVAENSRIRHFMKLLEEFDQAEDRELSLINLGRMMLASHEGYHSVGLGEPVTNRIVELVRERRGEGNDLYGARISGGGSGGTVTILSGANRGYEQVLEIKHIIERETGNELKLFVGSSDGAHYIN